MTCGMCARARAEVRLVLAELVVTDVCAPCGRRVWRLRAGKGITYGHLGDVAAAEALEPVGVV